MFDVLTLISFSLIGMTFCKKYELAGVAFVILVCIIAVFLLVRAGFNFRLPRKGTWNEKIQNLILSTKLLTKDNKKAFLFILSYSILIWFISIMFSFILILGFFIHLSIGFSSIMNVIGIFLYPTMLIAFWYFIFRFGVIVLWRKRSPNNHDNQRTN